MKRRGRPPHPDILTPREWEVLELLRAGLTNDEIARRLGISLQGAKFHVSEILAKLQLPDRAAAAQWQPPTRGGVASLFAPLVFVPRKLAGVFQWRSVQLAIAVGSALILAIVVGTVVVASVFVFRSRGGGRAAGLVIGKGVGVPLLLDGDRIGASSLSGAPPSPISGPGSYSDVQFDATGHLLYVDSSGEEPGFYRVEGGQPRRLISLWPGIVSYRARWAPDGSRAAWIDTGGRLRIGEPDQSPISGPPNVSGFLWSRDSTRLMAWSADRSTVSIVDARDGASSVTPARAPASWSTTGDVATLMSPPATRFPRRSCSPTKTGRRSARSLWFAFHPKVRYRFRRSPRTASGWPGMAPSRRRRTPRAG